MREDWIEIELGKICSVNMGQSPPSSTYNKDGDGMPFFQGKAEFTELHPVVEKWCTAPKKTAKNGDILMSVRAPVGSTNIANIDCAIGRGLAAITYPFGYRYLWYFLKLIERKLDNQGTGTTFKAISGSVLKSQIVPIAPLPEQRAIVAKIEQLFSELDNGIANLKAAKDKLEIYRQAVLKKAFEGELTKEWREQQIDLPTADEVLEQIKEERLKHYENQLTEWEEAVSKWESNGKQGKKPSKPKRIIKYPKCKGNQIVFALARLGEITFQISQKFMPEEAPELPFIGMDCIDKNGLEPTFTYKFKELTSAGNWFNRGHILYGRLRPYLNKLFLSGYEGIASGEFIILETIESINRKYLLYYLHQQEFVNWSNVQSSGDKPRVKYDQISLKEIPIPSINEQTQIVREIESRLSVCDNILTNIGEGLEKCEGLRQSILKQAFEGELLSEEELESCKQEPDWMPAEKLLENIETQKNSKVRS